MRNAVRKTIGIVVLAFVMVLSVCAGVAVSVAKAAVFTNNLFYASGVSLTNNAFITQGGRNGTLASPSRSGAYLKIDRAMVGLTGLEFGIADTDAMGDFVISFNGESNGVYVDFVNDGNGFTASVVESGESLGSAAIADAKSIALSFDANGREVAVNGTRVCGVKSVLPTYEVVFDFGDVDGTGDDIILYAINEHSLAQPIMTNRSGPTIFAEFSVKGVVNNFYTLPKPYGCDLLDGATEDFEVEVRSGSSTVAARSAYTATSGFTPAVSGKYTVIYYAQDSGSMEGSQSYELTVLSLAEFTPTAFTFDSTLENLELGVGSSMIIPNCSITSASVSKGTYAPVLTVRKDGSVLSEYNGVEVGVSETFGFSESGEYEFIYKASDGNVVGENGFTVSVVENKPAINIPNFRAYYFTNDKIELPAATMTFNGKTVSAQSVLNFPVSKKAVATNKASLSENGLYNIEYRATIDGKMYVYNRYITVYQRAYETKEGYAAYTTSPMEEDVSGVLVKLTTGDSIRLNGTIDISGKKPGQPVLMVDIIPSKYDVTDFMQLNVKFTDIYDESNYVTISCRRSRDEEVHQQMSYVKAGYKNQAQVGLESGRTPYIEPSIWGEYVSCSFTGLPANTFYVSFDYENRTIYANTKKIIELNSPLYFDELWSGFTTGECYVTISVQELRSMEATFMITKAGDIDLTEAAINDTEAPIIDIDTEYELSGLPYAVVGRPYRIFDATAYDMICGETEVISSVYYAYTGSAKGQINVVDGAFTPFIKGRYTIEYRATDFNGNVGIKTATVYAFDSLEDMTIEALPAPAGSLLVGHEAEVAGYTVSGSNGNAEVDIVAKNKATGNEYPVEDGAFIPYESGEFDVIYTATDYIGRTATASYAVTIGNDGLAVFKDEAELPFVMIQGAAYELPELTAYAYDENGEREVAVTILVKDADGTNEITGEYIPNVANSGDTVEITYKATTSVGDTEKKYYVPVQIIKNDRDYDMTKYFIGDVTVTADANNVIVTAADDALVRFIRPLIANNFAFDFDVNVEMNGFGSLDIYLTDISDPNVRVKFSYIKGAGGTAYMAVNDGVAVSSASSFTNGTKNKFVVSYNSEKSKLSDELGNGIKITHAICGEAFEGFPSGRVYFEFGFSGVSGQSQIKINSINSQKFSNSTVDNVRPQMFIDGVLGGSYEIGSYYDIPVAYALDVLDPTVLFNMTVELPSGAKAVDTQGETLNKVDPGVARRIVLTESGIYKFSYTARDTSNRIYSFTTIITVPDLVSPTLTISGGVPATAGFNGTVILPSATAYKNGEILTKYNDLTDADEPVNVVVFVICPNTRRERAVRNADNGTYSYTFTQKGEHTVVYVVYDESGNMAEQRFTVKVS